ncbi:hypothetical protein M8C21_012501, partial [Ambrosia artemisiifolia]
FVYFDSYLFSVVGRLGFIFQCVFMDPFFQFFIACSETSAFSARSWERELARPLMLNLNTFVTAPLELR